MPILQAVVEVVQQQKASRLSFEPEALSLLRTAAGERLKITVYLSTPCKSDMDLLHTLLDDYGISSFSAIEMPGTVGLLQSSSPGSIETLLRKVPDYSNIVLIETSWTRLEKGIGGYLEILSPVAPQHRAMPETRQ